MIHLDVPALKHKHNLLAFSAGIDSSALFFLLIENNIKFDIAIVDYGLREESKQELRHAKKLAKEYKLFCHTIQAPLFNNHFEQQARAFRYDFFDSLAKVEGYDNILTAHQLNDQLEWLLMRLTKGAGASELIGLRPLTSKKNYTLVRPLLQYSKDQLLDYLHDNNYPYFLDASNSNEKYERNKFRKQFSNALISEYKNGIQRSFEYLREDKEILESGFETLYINKELHIIKLHNMKLKVKTADLTLKKLGYLLSASQRKEIVKKDSLVIGGKWAIEVQNSMLYIAPYLKKEMPKEMKEKYRLLKIPSKIRPYLFKENINPNFPFFLS